MQVQPTSVVSLYVVQRGDGNYFAGYDAGNRQAVVVATPLTAKKFTNKYDIKLRPDEKLVELQIDLSTANPGISEPFRPHRRKPDPT